MSLKKQQEEIKKLFEKVSGKVQGQQAPEASPKAAKEKPKPGKAEKAPVAKKQEKGKISKKEPVPAEADNSAPTLIGLTAGNPSSAPVELRKGKEKHENK